MFDFDLFILFTRAIFVAVTAYYVLWTITLLRQVRQLLAGNDPSRRLLRLYVSYCLVTIDLRALRGELLQLAAWTLTLLVLFWFDMKI